MGPDRASARRRHRSTGPCALTHLTRCDSRLAASSTRSTKITTVAETGSPSPKAGTGAASATPVLMSAVRDGDQSAAVSSAFFGFAIRKNAGPLIAL